MRAAAADRDERALEHRVAALLDAGHRAAASLALADAVAAGIPAHAAAGMAQLAAGEPAAALRALRLALAAGDDRPVTRLNLALAERDAGDAARAESLLRALECDAPSWPEPPARLGAILGARGEALAAAAAYARALALDPARLDALHGLATLDVPPWETRWIVELLSRSCARTPDCWQAWDALALALARAGARWPP